MRKFSAVLLLLLLSIVLIACGSSDAKNDNEKQNETESNNSASNEQLETDANIVSTTVAITEIMEKLELDLVGVPTSYKDLPERYKDATEVGNPMDPDLEVVLSLQLNDVSVVLLGCNRGQEPE